MPSRLFAIIQLIERLGMARLLFQLRYRLSKRTGLLKRKFPVYLWNSKQYIGDPDRGREGTLRSVINDSDFFFNATTPAQDNELLSFLDNRSRLEIISLADDVVSGHIRYFSKHIGQFGDPPDWFANPFTEQHSSSNSHWCDIPDFLASQGDIKFIWEPSRFAWMYALVRAYAITPDEKYPNAFWQLVEDWMDSNPPQVGANWKCGQECAFRIMALCFGLFGFLASPSTTNERINQIITMIAVHAERIEKNIGYAVSLKNNHSISEALGLYTVGILFPWMENAQRWGNLARKILITEGTRQIATDGSFIQNSMNYHRLMLQDYLWAMRLGEINGDVFPAELLDRLRLATEFIYQMMDLKTGRVPNYGANDGSLILPLNNCDYLDYRPVVQAMSYLLNCERRFEAGPWDEDLVWLFGVEALNGSTKKIGQRNAIAHAGGYYTFRGHQSWAMVRCHSYRDRPCHADMLHFDIWHKEINLLRDAGSFQYYCDEPWAHYFESTAAHNTVEIDGKDQMEKGSRFLWLNWTKSKLRHNEHFEDFDADYWEGEHYGYRNGRHPVIHRRAIVRIKDCWIIVDDILGSGVHSAILRWHLADISWERMSFDTFSADSSKCKISVNLFPKNDPQIELVYGQKEPAEGWESLYYGERTPIPVIKCQKRSRLPLRFITTIILGNASFKQIREEEFCILNKDVCFRLNQQSIKAERIATLVDSSI